MPMMPVFGLMMPCAAKLMCLVVENSEEISLGSGEKRRRRRVNYGLSDAPLARGLAYRYDFIKLNMHCDLMLPI